MAEEVKKTNLEEDEFQKYVNEYIDRAVETRVNGGKGTQLVQDKPAAEPIKIKLGDEEYKFNNVEELNAGIVNMANNYNQELERLKKLAGTGQQETKPTGPSFDKEKFATAFIDDPLKGHNMALEAMFGFENPVGVLKSALQTIESQRQWIEAEKFKGANKDFPSDNPKVAGLVGEVVGRLGLPANSESLTAAWALIKDRGLYKAPEKQPPQETFVQDRGFGGLPTVTRQGLDDNTTSRLQNLSLEQLQELIERAQGR